MTHQWELAWKEGRWQELSPVLPIIVDYAEFLANTGARRVLDLGCGAGRHLVYLASKGFEVVGLDVSDTALAMCSDRLFQAGFKNTILVKHEMLELPFIDNYFDSVFSTNVIHHAPIPQIKTTINEIHRVLKNNGTVLVTVASDSDYRNHTGEKTEDNTYVFTEGDEVGITHHFFKEDELAKCFERFEIASLSEELIPVKEGQRGHFQLKARKP
jgi:ubiquinone/menaquinone biosynthesis C-methylase UbiE